MYLVNLFDDLIFILTIINGGLALALIKNWQVINGAMGVIMTYQFLLWKWLNT